MLSLSVEAGSWPPDREMEGLAKRAIGAVLAELASRLQLSPSSTPPRKKEGLSSAELSLVFTDDAHIRALNRQFRGKDKPTNVLSFPQAPGGPLLGDIVLGYETIHQEAELAGRPIGAHIAHLIIHGFLHLIGYDHQVDDEAETMERLERAALARIGIADPYAASR